MEWSAAVFNPGKVWIRYGRFSEHWQATYVPTHTMFKCADTNLFLTERPEERTDGNKNLGDKGRKETNVIC